MANTFTERVRLSAADERLLRRLAKERKATKSDIFRLGLKLVANEDERERRRREGIEGLIRLAREVPGTAIKFGLR